MNSGSYIFWTAASQEEAKRIARLLLSKKLIACASLIPNVHSLFLWKGQIEEAIETKVIFKAKKDLYPMIRSCIEENCSYQIPEIILIEWSDANQPYWDWVKNSNN